MIKKTFTVAKNTAAFFIAAVNAFNPFAYGGITQKSLQAVIMQLLYLLLIVTLAMAALTIPSLASVGSKSQLPLDKFSNLTLKAEIATKAPIESELFWLGNAKVLVNTTADAAATGKYDFVLTSTELRSRPFPCLFRQELCSILGIKHKAVPIKELDLAQRAQKNRAALQAFILLLLPGLIILLFLSMVVKYVAVSAAAALIGFIILKIARKDTGLFDALKIAFYAANALVILDAALFLLRHTGAEIPSFIPLAAYLVLIIAAVMANEQRLSDSMI
ncbi:hypothetical protein HYU40_03720 [Candidatus Woesearchaeota archaeon]|nr:hypothetical protein [Candidatus Woesearchaeota archaeon]